MLATAIDFLFLIGLSFFLGFTFEDVCAKAGVSRPGGVRTFPMLALVGAALYSFDPTHLLTFALGLAIVGAWLTVYYREHMREPDEAGRQNVGLMVVLMNLYAYLLGGVAFALPHWAAVGMTVLAVLLFTSRQMLHDLARRVEIGEIVIAAQFLILTGLVLPLLPASPVTTLTSITPRQAWLAVVVVCALSYASYLVQRYARASGGLWMAALGGLYSSTATTVVLARQARTDPSTMRQAQAGITLASGIMYLRILIVVAIFNRSLAGALAIPLSALFVAGLAIAIVQYARGKPEPREAGVPVSRNPLELWPAVTFALLFVAISLLSSWIKAHFGVSGVYSLAAVVGFADIDPFVLSLAQGSAGGIATSALAAAILIAASSNDLLKAVYAGLFAGWRASLPSVAALVFLACAGLVIAWTIVG
jgi:uncharacterized membrane protein (DUF4010 family)